MNKTLAIGTIAASVIAGSTLIGFLTTTIADRNTVQAKQIVMQEIQHQAKLPKPNLNVGIATNNDSFRNVAAYKQSLIFDLQGEARVFEGTYNYAIKQGRKIIASGFGTASMGGPEWGEVNQKIAVPVKKLSGHDPLTIELYEIDQESGKQVRKVNIPLTLGTSSAKSENESFRNMKIAPASLKYSIKGEARMFEGTYNYVVKQGEKEITTGFGTASIGAPDWGKVNQTITIPTAKLNGDQPLTLELFSLDQESGEAVDKLTFDLA
ncbi:Gmad2 immunoglobulin-like domain-containing protein [Cohnella herbarum]|uniref:Spore gernimation protein n=1 Tax=Cohnella herbarum TaxID=2728023 RepID=A0A7Z2VF66_9BACL|nr:Gmad2 immunoglobulin-like domain-containing protein [Cohnella herbarum]QJD81779.1 spore gernimation protein [Cohnella herbarum]